MPLDTRWKNPQGSDPRSLHLWAQDVIKELRRGDYLPATPDAADIAYDNTLSGLAADDVQEGLDELAARTGLARAYAAYTANADLSAAIPADDTIPQIGEGTQILSAAVTLKAATNRVRARFQGTVGISNNDFYAIAALFLGAGADALMASGWRPALNTEASGLLAFELEHAPGAVGPHTYTVRAGPSNASANIRFNGTTSARLFGGVSAATLVLEEIWVP